MAGTDSWDNSAEGVGTRVNKLLNYDYEKDPALVNRMREATHRILYTVANSAAMNGMSTTSEIVSVIPWWRGLIYGVGALAALGFVASVVMVVKTKKKNEA